MREIVSGLLVLLVCCSGAAIAQGDAEAREPFEFPLLHTGRGLTLHKEMGILPVTWSDEYNGKQTEVVFQLSAKHDILGSPVYVAYSQISFWQAYDSENSSPFRDTNYNPEIFYRSKTRHTRWGTLGGDAGFEHESNGQRVPLSRSWNLLYVAPNVRGDRWMVYAKARYRLPEDDKEYPLAPQGDDNPDITDYLGYGDIHVYFSPYEKHLAHLLVRGYVGADKGNFSLSYSLPAPGSKSAFLMLRFFHGHGECLLDYNRSNTRVGIGMYYNR